ncbi:putative germin-like protein 9-2 [Platanthera zijinensis]|uniref:Germin-like protein n=1 Tax=Platanthera zijinensis TaxID=2320716 RepID=A0AAP0GEA3_9ASPA
MAAFRAGTVVLFAVLAVSLRALAGDPDITVDFITPPGVTPDGEFFAFRGLNRVISGGPSGVPFMVTKLNQEIFPALAGQSVSLAVLQFGPGAAGVNPPHAHPRSAELLMMLQGVLNVGFVDSANRLFNQTLYVGDAFVFPKGLVHYQVNGDAKKPAVAISAFGSANPGTISLPKTIFGSQIQSSVLEESFKTDAGVIGKLVAANSD